MALSLQDVVQNLPLGKGVKVLAIHPSGLIALEKPHGVLSHPNVEVDRRRSLLNASWSKDRERYAWKIGDGSERLYLLHRLDAATSGVILACLNQDLARALKKEFSKRNVSKTYRAVVSGMARKSDTLWKDHLRKRKIGSQLRVDANVRGGALAETRVKLVQVKQSKPMLSLLEFNPITGRTHQLRVQSAKRNMPILGDSTYGNFQFNRDIQKVIGNQRLFLHSASIYISWIWEDTEYTFEAKSDTPEIFKQVMELKI
jgi:23S rRNA-/tRNA-specific pseudouridylate synthase